MEAESIKGTVGANDPLLSEWAKDVSDFWQYRLNLFLIKDDERILIVHYRIFWIFRGICVTSAALSWFCTLAYTPVSRRFKHYSVDKHTAFSHLVDGHSFKDIPIF